MCIHYSELLSCTETDLHLAPQEIRMSDIIAVWQTATIYEKDTQISHGYSSSYTSV